MAVMQRRIAQRAALAALALVLAAPLAACSSGSGSPATDWNAAGDTSYISGDGTAASIPPEQRDGSVEFSGVSDHGGQYGSADTLGSVTVVNFWYAGCPPCRAEAPDLVAAYDEFAAQGVKFVGVNTRDGLAQALQFAKEFGVEYPSILDNEGDRGVQRAFAGQVPLNAVPTTLVLDREGRVAHRIIGMLPGESALRTLITETLAEG